MDTNYLKRACRSFLDSSGDLLNDQTNIEAVKRTRLYATQIIDLLEEDEDDFIELLCKLTHPSLAITLPKDLVNWLKIFTHITCYTHKRKINLIVASMELYHTIFVPVLKYSGFLSEIMEREDGVLVMTISISEDAKVGSIDHKNINHEYGDLLMTQKKMDMYFAFMYRELRPTPNSIMQVQDTYYAELQTSLWRDLGIRLDVKTLKCTADDERLGEIICNRLL
jgi:hypothetical protein